MTREQVHAAVFSALQVLPPGATINDQTDAVLRFLDTLVDDTLETKVIKLRDRTLAIAALFELEADNLDLDPETRARTRIVAQQRRAFARRLELVLR